MNHSIYEYRLRTDKGHWLADVILRSDGFFSTVSDWGNYAFRWTHPGMEFRAFVAQLEGQDDYVCSKLAKRDWWDGEQTLKNIKHRITSGRRDGWLTKARAEEEWGHLIDACATFWSEGLNGVREMDHLQFSRFYDKTSLDDAGELASYDYPPDVRGFCREVMPRLAAAIRAELTAEAALAQACVDWEATSQRPSR